MTEEQAQQIIEKLDQLLFVAQAIAIPCCMLVGIKTWQVFRISIRGLWD